MLIAALVCGLLGGIIGLFIGFGTYSLYAVAAAAGAGFEATLYQILSIAAPVVSIIGGALAQAKPFPAAILMILAAIGMFLSFGFSSLTGIPLVLTAVGGIIAIVGASQAKGPAQPRAM